MVLIGTVGRWLTLSQSLLHTSFLALALIVNWFFGFILSHRVRNELKRILHSDLNGQIGFEMLMLYTMIQILFLVTIFLFILTTVNHLTIEIKEMGVLAQKENGDLWIDTYDQMPLQTVQAILISFSIIQTLLLATIMIYMFRFAMQGIRWSNVQIKSRSRGFFLIIACLILPIYDTYFAYFSKDVHDFLTYIPELQGNLMPNALLWVIYGFAIFTMVMAVFGFISVLTGSKRMVQGFIFIKMAQLLAVIVIILYLIVNLIRFSSLAGFGTSAYLSDNWPRVMKFIDMNMYDSGITACSGGKYIADTPILTTFDNI